LFSWDTSGAESFHFICSMDGSKGLAHLATVAVLNANKEYFLFFFHWLNGNRRSIDRRSILTATDFNQSAATFASWLATTGIFFCDLFHGFTFMVNNESATGFSILYLQLIK
jgi:hypothetical protein